MSDEVYHYLSVQALLVIHLKSQLRTVCML